MSITAVASATSASADTASSSRVPKQTLGQEDFLKLITVQLAKQDPMSPMQDTDFMAQMAQFSALEQSSQMARDMAALRTDLAGQTAAAFIGREAVVRDADGGLVAGAVEAVDYSTGAPRVLVGGAYHSVSQIVRVAPAAQAA